MKMRTSGVLTTSGAVSLTSSMTTLTYLRALQATIGTALDDIERVYKAHGVDYPSPDVPCYRNDPGSVGISGVDLAEKLTNDPVVANAASLAVAACGQLTDALHNPYFNLVESVSAVSPVPLRSFQRRYQH